MLRKTACGSPFNSERTGNAANTMAYHCMALVQTPPLVSHALATTINLDGPTPPPKKKQPPLLKIPPIGDHQKGV